MATVDVSTDGRVVAFVSLARLTAADDNTAEDIYVLERATGTISLESASSSGRASDGSSQHPRLSGDGRFLVFSTVATSLVGSQGEAVNAQVLRRDRTTGVMTLVSHTPAGAPGNGWSGVPDISDDGRFVVFESHATDLVAGPDGNGGGSDIYLFDAADGVLRRISVTTAGEQLATGQSATPAISGTGRVVAFSSTAPLDAPPGRPEPAGGPPVRLRARPHGRRHATHQHQPRSGRPERRQLLPRHQRRRAPHRVRVHRDQPRRRRSRQAAGEHLPPRRSACPG